MLKGLGSQRLVALFAGGWVLFNFPLLGLWDRELSVLGVPLFPLALFVWWALLIAALAWLMERGDRQAADAGDERTPDRASAPVTTGATLPPQE
ncbi:MAG: hypothetical protein L6Q63_16570 [Giesbergeria sp.]|nr:hypothetical protein [Giesbergeria sp.]